MTKSPYTEAIEAIEEQIESLKMELERVKAKEEDYLKGTNRALSNGEGSE